ncbi:DUF2303 family protein [Falsigemmobacter faecalis]|uniref:DUF2303 family protein n=1 Tax=Falsigemmobacter faecalis TaxID=2488730 RepID=A0A3P3DCA4_9RHOB|nr:DUF2303 family protein [Falsigemmobacter faecalis]RRH70028.1 DUF2303 family protein [Falsigemmobacter faecalis]
MEALIRDTLSQLQKATTVQNLITTHPEEHPTLTQIAVPEGMQRVDLTAEIDKIATKLQPWRRSGTAKLTNLDSLIYWANRNKGETSVLFADTGDQPKLTCIADYIGEGAPVIDPLNRDPKSSHMLHRAVYAFPLSREWKVWQAISGKPMTGAELGEFVENNAKDLLEPTPALLTSDGKNAEQWEKDMLETAHQLQGRFGQYLTLMQLARNFQINEVSNISASINRDTGESSIQFLNEHKEPDGGAVQIPNLFMIAIPVFENGAYYRLAVRFRYRKAGSGVNFIFTLHNADIALRNSIDEAITRAMEETDLPVLYGHPEG